jgi:hypothetical protein
MDSTREPESSDGLNRARHTPQDCSRSDRACATDTVTVVMAWLLALQSSEHLTSAWVTPRQRVHHVVTVASECHRGSVSLAATSVACKTSAMELVACALRHARTDTVAPPSRTIATNANVDGDITPGTVQNPLSRYSTDAGTSRLTVRRIDSHEVMRDTLSGRIPRQRIYSNRRAASARRDFSEASGGSVLPGGSGKDHHHTMKRTVIAAPLLVKDETKQ